MCQYCKVKSNYKPSARSHRGPPRRFFICTSCGEEVQGIVENGEVREIPARPRNPTALMVVRVPRWEKEAWLEEREKTGMTARQWFEKAPR